MPYPQSPINGQQANINGITYTYSTSLTAWTVSTSVSNSFVSISVSGNITGGNLLNSGLISATGNITGNYIFGNGSQLTGVDAGGNLLVVGRSATYYVPIISSFLTIVSRTGNISVPINS